MKPGKKSDNPCVAAGLVGVMGLDVAVCILIGYWLGKWAGSYFGSTQGWVIGGVLAGLAAGIVTAVFLLKIALEDSDG